MNILVCVKQVPEAGSSVNIHGDGKRICITDTSRFELNPYDAYAVEAAVQTKEKFPGTTIDAVTVGPSRSADALRRALGMGADEGIHIVDEGEAIRPPALTAAWIARVAEKKAYDLILTGMMSDDEMNGQTGPLIAHMTGRPCITAAIGLDVQPDRGLCRVEREIEGGAKDLFDVRMPCVLAVQTGMNAPRYPSLSKVLRAKKKTFQRISASSLPNVPGQPSLCRLKAPRDKIRGVFLQGTARDKADELADLFFSRGML